MQEKINYNFQTKAFLFKLLMVNIRHRNSKSGGGHNSVHYRILLAFIYSYI